MNSPLDGEPRTAPRPPRRRWYWRCLRFLALSTATLVVLLGLLTGIENFRGWREWSAERDRLVARGVRVEYLDFVPPPIPEAANFAEIPLLRPLLRYDYTTNGVRWHDTNAYAVAMAALNQWFPNTTKEPSGAKSWTQGWAVNLQPWQSAFRALAEYQGSGSALPARNPPHRPIPLPATNAEPAAEVLAALSVHEPEFAVLAAGIRERPQARFGVHYEEDFSALLPHLAKIKLFVSRFGLRASARLAAGQTDGAFEDLRSGLMIADAPKGEPFLISQLVRIACFDLALQPLWEGQTTHRWSEAQLAAMQDLAGRFDPLPEFRRSIDLERSALARVVGKMGGSLAERRRYAGLFDDFRQHGTLTTPPWLECYLLLAPRGWFYASVAEASRTLTRLNETSLTNVPTIREAWLPAPDSRSVRLVLYNACFSSNISGRMGANLVTGVRGLVHARLAATACALERHRLAHGQYPETLGALVPKYLATVPEDPVTAQPLRYRRDDPQQFHVWSVGEDGRDDGGAWPVATGPKEPVPGPETGDWVWAFP